MRSSELIGRALVAVILLVSLYFLYSITIGLDVAHLPLTSEGKFTHSDLPLSLRILSWIQRFETPDQLGAAVSSATFFVSTLLGIVALIVPLMKAPLIASQIRKHKDAVPYDTYPVRQHGIDDIAVMLRYFRGASRVRVFAGDFSWIKGDSEMARLVAKFLEEGRIQLFSHKSRGELVKTLGSKKFEEILPHLTLHQGPELKASMVQMQGGAQYFLYKKARAAAAEVVVFRNEDVLVEPLGRFGEMIEGISPGPIVVFVCGETGSGKSTVARQIATQAGAQIISVGEIFRRWTILAGRQPGRNEVIDTGLRYLEQIGSDQLAIEIGSRIDTAKSVVVIDGVRPLATLSALKDRFPRHLTIYVDAPRHLRRARTSDIDLDDMDDRVDAMVTSLKGYSSTLVLDNDTNDLGSLSKLVQEKITRRFSYLASA